MDSLRWVLLIIGALLVGGICAFTVVQKRRQSGDGDAASDSSEQDPWHDDLPSLDQLEAARAAHTSEGAELPPLDEEVVEEIRAADEDRRARQRERELAELGISDDDTLPVTDEPRLGGYGDDNPPLRDGRPEPRLQHGDSEPLTEVDGPALNDHEEPEVHQPSLLADEEPPAQAAPESAPEPTPEPTPEPEPKPESTPEPGPNTSSADEEARMVERASRQRVEEAARRRVQQQAQAKSGGQVSGGQSAARASAEARAAQSPKTPQSEAPQRAAPARESSNSNSRRNEEVVVLYIKASDSIGLYAPEIIECLESMGFRFGDMDIYHYHSNGQRIVSVANIKKPGTFDPENSAGVTTPGLAMFLQLRRESDFEFSEQVLVKSAKYLAGKLKAIVLDEHRKELDTRGEQALRMRIQSIRRKLQPADKS
ncbi:MAG: cell division protein ZipA C-terminal FtsZ-binding domain-containing protein [Pseudomonadota bacterium]